MGAYTTMTSKGQITIPKEVRDELGLAAGDSVLVEVRDGVLILVPKCINFNDLAGYLGEPPNGAARLEEIDETIAEAMANAALPPSATARGKAA
ncbi:AbrB/MazE/SpoVT family DNA-binding domain-containing protein [Aquibium sp. ELW1220]|jgi:antitoxin PrlF|uniref:AbrB/MazE/SpoVT family DNA-binding domain-containing protein n=1 Tax=Aquibium sp. ELW1220 TaxID=2976766 RepID=UPI0025AF9A14|nr:AbrB/MazE/SpoVT family DNA-binding domain-containing protein [Aquibium sp. ELW1220]MDN2579922.1 AbrB/MazE/SpoVT family DNA-binding domain-containing protein [Aquibium sp. ELW1220]